MCANLISQCTRLRIIPRNKFHITNLFWLDGLGGSRGGVVKKGVALGGVGTCPIICWTAVNASALWHFCSAVLGLIPSVPSIDSFTLMSRIGSIPLELSELVHNWPEERWGKRGSRKKDGKHHHVPKSFQTVLTFSYIYIITWDNVCFCYDLILGKIINWNGTNLL